MSNAIRNSNLTEKKKKRKEVTHQVRGGLVHIGLGNPVENICCQVIQDLLELEATICLCTAISLKLLDLNIFIPLALQVLEEDSQEIPKSVKNAVGKSFIFQVKISEFNVDKGYEDFTVNKVFDESNTLEDKNPSTI
ncbi:hypothetical protein RJ639_036684 [Escallonia herrerae]|uniref:Hydrophobic seed protein domain-containing protein n=1 Tax=Escallonia herrerae TaxID=1293975 RepID=A0AA89BGB6_9ASTE|nr:hypothetical protein RJ639_036684 [Escallonia herrerae]